MMRLVMLFYRWVRAYSYTDQPKRCEHITRLFFVKRHRVHRRSGHTSSAATPSPVLAEWLTGRPKKTTTFPYFYSGMTGLRTAVQTAAFFYNDVDAR